MSEENHRENGQRNGRWKGVGRGIKWRVDLHAECDDPGSTGQGSGDAELVLVRGPGIKYRFPPRQRIFRYGNGREIVELEARVTRG